MKTMKLLPLKIAVTSAMIVGLGMASTANAQQQKSPKTETFLPNIFFNEYADDLDTLYHNMILGDTAITHDDQYKFYADDATEVPDSLFFNKILHDQLLYGFKEGDKIIPLDENGKPVYKLDKRLENGVQKTVYSVTTKTATADDVNSAYSRGIQGDIDDLYEANKENVNRLIEHGDKIFANEESVQYLNREVQNNIENIHELAQQQDQHSSDIKTLKNNVEEGLLDLSGRLIDQKADIAQNQANIQDLAAYNELQDQYAQKQTEAIDALNKASSENTQNIEDLAAYNKLQDAYAKQQTEAIDALNKASSANTDRIATAELGIAENKKDAQIAKAQANENKDGIAKNQADIQLHDKKITNLGILHSMVARAVGNNTQGVATNKADIAKNQADIANNIKNIYELAQQQDQHSSDIKTLAKVSAANTDRIAKNKAEADASFETLTKNQNTLIEQGEALVEQNKAINQELEGFAAHADVQDKQILQNQADITTNKTAIEQNINRTVANGFEIEKNKAGIATNKQELILQNDRLNRINETNNHQDQKIDQLGYALKEQGQHFNNRISAVERQTAGGIANAIAIATLPSPSRAGEHHVLFGSGYHNGQAAVSLGAAGLSDTGKSTYKIGLSWSDAGGLSGGVGGSYRWK